MGRQTQFAPQFAHLVLEQLAQRLDELHVHALGQAADIVVRLDGDGRAAGEGHALDHVRVERALGEEGRTADLFGLGLEHLDEQSADGLALGFGVGNALESAEELFGFIHVNEGNVVGIAEQAHHLFGLAGAHQAVVDEDAGELGADGLVDEHRRHGAVDAARQAADDALEADLSLDVVDRLVAERGHGPVAAAAADLDDEIAVEPRTVRRVHHLGVELQPVDLPVLVADGGEGGAFRGADHVETLGQRDHPVAVAHPHLVALALAPHAVEQGAMGRHLEKGAAEFAMIGGLDLAAQLGADRLLAIADAEHRQAE